tara:strand:- start:684 stop:857 length:174 start_codon:yes stop_codon:yes gene_type:complete
LKLNVQFPELEALVDKMGAKPVKWRSPHGDGPNTDAAQDEEASTNSRSIGDTAKGEQ